jgi:hypothetical protein
MSQPDGAAHVGARRTRVPQDPPSSGPTVHATEPLGWSSLLFTSAADASPAGCQGAPTYFGDLNLDQLVDAVSGGDDALASILHRALDDVDAIEFRHQVWRDLERPDVLVALRRFTDRMVVVRRLLGVASSMRSPGSGSAGSSTRPRSIARTSPACALPWTVPSRGHGPDLGAAVACLIRHLSRLHPPGHRPVGDHGGAGRGAVLPDGARRQRAGRPVRRRSRLRRRAGVGDPVTATMLLRAERESDGRRTFRLMPGRSLPTSYGPDLYARILDPHAEQRELRPSALDRGDDAAVYSSHGDGPRRDPPGTPGTG